MNKDALKLYIDRLKNDDEESINETVSPEFLNSCEKDLSFHNQVVVSGQAYLANQHLILDLKIHTLASIPCAICNEQTKVLIEVDDFALTVELGEIKSAIYDFSDDIRHAILLKIPPFTECHKGKCPNRKELNKFLNPSSEPIHTPFSELDLES